MSPDRGKNRPFPVVGVGASAGGLDALKELFRHLPRDGMAYVIVQPLDPSRESLLAKILTPVTEMKVLEARQGAELGVNRVYTIPPNTYLTLVDGKVNLTPRQGESGLFLPIDRFFHSLAATYGPRSVGVVLSGGGSDGSLGLQEIKAAGGITFAQIGETSQVSSMHLNAVSTGSVDFVLSPKDIGEAIARLGRQKHWLETAHEESPKTTPEAGEELRNLLVLVHKLGGVDFSHYKPPTLLRRIALCQDVLIQVTRFFRDEDAFRQLHEHIFPALFRDRNPKDPVRIWIPGCATGEEAYSILISLTEYMIQAGLRMPVQLFGTDVSEAAINRARTGTYFENSVADLSPERLRKFFNKTGTEYTIDKSLRDSCIFAKHNILTDPPFARMDLLSCQNVLIYFDKSLQKRVLSIFHYALKPSGVLLLGRAESTSARPELFAPLEPAGRAFHKIPTASRLYYDFAGVQSAADKVLPVVSPLGGGRSFQGDACSEGDGPAPHFRVRPAGRGVRRQAGGDPVQGPHRPLLRAFPRIRQPGTAQDAERVPHRRRAGGHRGGSEKKERARREGVRVRLNGHTVRVAIEVFPVRPHGSEEQFFLLTFENTESLRLAHARRKREWRKEEETLPPGLDEIVALRAELAATKEYLQSVNEDKEAANEELKAANEEIMSSNEELQSTNEELLTVNDELQHRNEELTQLNNDLSNLFESLNVGVVMLTRELGVRKFTNLARQLLRLSPADVGRSIGDLRPKLDIDDLEATLERTLRTMVPTELQARGPSGKWYSVQIRPYRTNDNRIDGVVLILMDISEMRATLDYAEAVEETIGEPLLLLTGDLKVKRANRKFYKVFGMKPETTEGRYVYELPHGGWDLPRLRQLLEEVLPRQASFSDFEMEHDFPGVGKRQIRLNGRRLHHHDKPMETILLVVHVPGDLG